jgi:hypothetical protein
VKATHGHIFDSRPEDDLRADSANAGVASADDEWAGLVFGDVEKRLAVHQVNVAFVIVIGHPNPTASIQLYRRAVRECDRSELADVGRVEVALDIEPSADDECREKNGGRQALPEPRSFPGFPL